MRKLIIAVLVLISLDSFAQPTNYTWYKQRIRQYSLMLDSMLYIPRYNGTPSGVRANETSSIDGAIAVDTANGRQYFYYNGSWRRLANYSELGVDSIWRVAGIDSIFWSKAGNTYKIKDSTGGGGSYTFSNGLTESGGAVKWGGTLTEDLYINGDGYDIFLGNYPGSGAGTIHLDADSVYLDPGIPSGSATDSVLVINGTTGIVKKRNASSFGGSTSPAGNFGNIQINRNGAFATPGSDSLDYESATGLSVKGNITGSNKLIIGSTTAPAVSQVYITGGVSGGNIDARGDSTSAQKDEANIEVQHADYDGVSRTGYGVAIQANGNVSVGSLLGYNIKNSGQLRFTNQTNVIRVIPNASLRFATNNTERMVLDSNGNVGIGVQVPSNKLHVAAATGSTTTPFYVNDSEDNTGYSAEFGKAGVLKAAIGTEGNIYMVDMSAPSTPSSGYGTIYVRTDSLRFKNDAGTEFTLGSGGGGSGANTALSNLSSVAINASLLPGTSDAVALGSTTKQWSDLFLAEGGVIDWDNGDMTLTQSGNTLTVAGGVLSNPGAGASSEIFGSGAAAAGTNGVAFGNGASASGVNSAAFGQYSSASNASTFVLGSSSTASGNASIAIGVGVTSSGTNSLSIGTSSQATNTFSVAIGPSASSTHLGSIAIGQSTTTTGNAQLVIGSQAAPMTTVYFDKGVVDAAPGGVTINATGGSGTNIAGGAMNIAGGKGTGNAAGGDINFQTSTVGASGTTLQTLATKLTISPNSAAYATRVLQAQGADVASAAGAITLGGDGNSFEITGTSSITAIVNTNWQNGATITLMFTSTATLTDGTANSGTSIGFELAGNTDFTATADDVITLILSEIGGTQRWREVSRSVN